MHVSVSTSGNRGHTMTDPGANNELDSLIESLQNPDLINDYFAAQDAAALDTLLRDLEADHERIMSEIAQDMTAQQWPDLIPRQNTDTGD